MQYSLSDNLLASLEIIKKEIINGTKSHKQEVQVYGNNSPFLQKKLQYIETVTNEVKGKKKKQFTRLCSIPLPLRERGHTQGQYSTNEYCLTHNFSTERLQSQVMDTVFVLFLKFLLTFLARNNSSTHNTVSPVFFYRHLIVLPVKSPSIHYRRRPGKWMVSRKTLPF